MKTWKEVLFACFGCNDVDSLNNMIGFYSKNNDLDPIRCAMEQYCNENHRNSLELLAEIEAWLCFNQSPSRENITALKKSINEHLEKYNYNENK